MGKILFVVFILAPAFIAINLIAQKIIPTNTSDPYGQRVIYRIVVMAIFLIAVAVVAVIGSSTR